MVGIASRILSRSGGSEGLGFVVAINAAKELLALEDRTWTGMDGVFLSAEELAALLHLDRPGGVLVQRVQPGSPAARAGLRGGTHPLVLGDRVVLLGGDLILSIGHQEACHGECLADAHHELARMDHVPLRFLRAGKILEATMDLSGSRRNFLRAESGGR